METKDQIQGQGDTERPDMGYSGYWGPEKGFKRVQGVMIQNTVNTGGQRKDKAGAVDQVHNARGHGTGYRGY